MCLLIASSRSFLAAIYNRQHYSKIENTFIRVKTTNKFKFDCRLYVTSTGTYFPSLSRLKKKKRTLVWQLIFGLTAYSAELY